MKSSIKGITFVIVIYAILLLMYLLHFNGGLSNDTANWGTFGDFLGGALSPIIGIISVVLTYKIINNQNLQDNQTEFKYMFEILFNSINEKQKSIKWKKLKGDLALVRINNDMEKIFAGLKQSRSKINSLELMRKAFWSVHEDINRSSAPFMKNLHNCLKAIDNHCADNRKKEYADLLRAQLSKEELIFIFYNGLAHDNFKNFKARVEKYGILKDVRNHHFDPELRNKYNESAFSDERDGKSAASKFLFSIFSRNFEVFISKS